MQLKWQQPNENKNSSAMMAMVIVVSRLIAMPKVWIWVTVRENDAVWMMMMIWDIKSVHFFFTFSIPFYHFQFIDQINNRHTGNTILCFMFSVNKEQINAINSLLLILYLFDCIFKTKTRQDFHTKEERTLTAK